MSATASPWHQPLGRALDKLGSLGFTCILLLFLLALTFLGTIEQGELGLHAVQKKYFESLIVYVRADFLVIPLPGARLVLALLFVNLVIGGIARLRKTWSRAGLLMAHLGIAFLLLAGGIEHLQSVEGHLTLYPQERSDEFVSYKDWEIAIHPAPLAVGEMEHVIAQNELPREGRATFVADDLPFDLILSDFLPNCWPERPGRVDPGGASVIEGLFLAPKAPSKKVERDIAGLVVHVREERSGATQRGLLWGKQREPWAFEVDGRTWVIHLRKRRWKLPFAIELDEFDRDLHPGTGMAKGFRSTVTRIEGDIEQKAAISMNEPLRHGDHTLYQSGWGPQNAPPGTPLFSSFAVVRNPVDQWPLIATIVISVGLLIHFAQKLLRHLRMQASRTR